MKNKPKSLSRQRRRGHFKIATTRFVIDDTGRNVRYLFKRTKRGYWKYWGKF